MRGIELKNGCIFYYGNPSGYVEEGTAIVDSMFQSDEFSQWIGNRKLIAKWTEGVFERLSKEGVLLINNERPVPLKDCRIGS